MRAAARHATTGYHLARAAFFFEKKKTCDIRAKWLVCEIRVSVSSRVFLLQLSVATRGASNLYSTGVTMRDRRVEEIRPPIST